MLFAVVGPRQGWARHRRCTCGGAIPIEIGRLRARASRIAPLGVLLASTMICSVHGSTAGVAWPMPHAVCLLVHVPHSLRASMLSMFRGLATIVATPLAPGRQTRCSARNCASIAFGCRCTAFFFCSGPTPTACAWKVPTPYAAELPWMPCPAHTRCGTVWPRRRCLAAGRLDCGRILWRPRATS